MQNLVIPGWMWINFGVLVAAAVLVGVKLAGAKTARQEGVAASRPAAPGRKAR